MTITITESPAPVPVQAPCEKQPGQLDEETRRDIQAARRKLLEHGWIQGTVGDSDGATCAMGAISYVAIKAHPSVSAFARIAFGSSFNHPNDAYGAIADWNDAPGRTFDEVIALFDRVLAG
jgi:hypothetical protein